jgi:hypothetical protein
MNDNMPTSCFDTLATDAAMNAHGDTNETGPRP